MTSTARNRSKPSGKLCLKGFCPCKTKLIHAGGSFRPAADLDARFEELKHIFPGGRSKQLKVVPSCMYMKKKSWHTAPLTFLAELLTMCHIVHHTQHAAICIICVIYGVVCVLSVLENLDVEAL